MKIKIVSIGVIIACLVFLVVCSNPTDTSVAVAGVSLNATTMNLVVAKQAGLDDDDHTSKCHRQNGSLGKQ